MPVWIGTSGWQYKDWRGRFYPERLAQARWLEHYVSRFATVEVNNTFYRLPRPETFATWRERVPAGFVMTIKVNRFITHIKQLRDPAESVHRFLEAARPLGERTGPLLLQLPPTLAVDPDRLRGALDAFPRRLRLAVEFRHPSWFTDEVASILRDRDAPLVLTDRRARLLEPDWRTAGWGYIRLHEGNGSPWPSYTGGALERWAERVASWWPSGSDVFVYFNNDPLGAAPFDASRFGDACREQALEVTRTPAMDELLVG